LRQSTAKTWIWARPFSKTSFIHKSRTAHKKRIQKVGELARGLRFSLFRPLFFLA
jgi:hypothetical protein